MIPSLPKPFQEDPLVMTSCHNRHLSSQRNPLLVEASPVGDPTGIAEPEAIWKGLTPLKTNSSHLKIGGWKTSFLLRKSIFRCELLVSVKTKHLRRFVDFEEGLTSPPIIMEVLNGFLQNKLPLK